MSVPAACDTRSPFSVSREIRACSAGGPSGERPRYVVSDVPREVMFVPRHPGRRGPAGAVPPGAGQRLSADPAAWPSLDTRPGWQICRRSGVLLGHDKLILMDV